MAAPVFRCFTVILLEICAIKASPTNGGIDHRVNFRRVRAAQSARAMAVEAMTSVTRLLEEVPLSPDERAAAEGDMAAYGLAVQMGVVVRERLQLRFQRFVYPGANRQRAAAQSAMLSIALPCHRANRRSLFTNAAAPAAPQLQSGISTSLTDLTDA
jgi:hypothetical protein